MHLANVTSGFGFGTPHITLQLTPRPAAPCPVHVARSNLRVCQLSRQEAEQFYAVHRGKPFFEKLTAFMSSGRIAAIELVGPGAVPKWRELIGPTDSNKARMEAPSSIRAHYGTDG